MRPVVRDVLDQLVLDEKGVHMGRADGIVLELRDGKPPRIAYLEIGAAVCANRVSGKLAKWIQNIERRWNVKKEDALHIPWSRVTNIDVDMHVDFQWRRTSAAAWEKWLDDHFIQRIPGAR